MQLLQAELDAVRKEIVSHASVTHRTKFNRRMHKDLFVIGSKFHVLRSHLVLWFLSSDPQCLQGWHPGAITPLRPAAVLFSVMWSCSPKDFPSSVAPCVSTMDIFDCPFQFQLKSMPQAALLVDCFCDLCRSRRVQASFIFKPGER